MTEQDKGAPRKPSAALTAALAQIAALQQENLTIGNLKAKVAALEHDVERKWQPTEVELRARIAELEPRLASSRGRADAMVEDHPLVGSSGSDRSARRGRKNVSCEGGGKCCHVQGRQTALGDCPNTCWTRWRSDLESRQVMGR